MATHIKLFGVPTRPSTAFPSRTCNPIVEPDQPKEAPMSQHEHHHEAPAPGTVDWRHNGVRVIKATSSTRTRRRPRA